MKIGIDLDGVVIDSENTWRVMEEIYDLETLNNEGVVDRSEPYFQNRYKWNQEQQNDFIKEFLVKGAKVSNLMPGFTEVYNLLKKQGHEFVVITARGGLDPIMIDEAIEKLSKNNIIFDKYYWNVSDKLEICKKENVDIMIEDNWRTVQNLTKNNIKTLYFRAAGLKILEEDKNLIEVNNWGDIYRYIKNVN